MLTMRECALGIVKNPKETHVLLVRRRDLPVWVLPGGGIDPGETPDEAVKRELKEETGLDVEVIDKVAEYSPVNRFTSRVHIFSCKAVSSDMNTTDETDAIGFFNEKTLPPTLFHYHKEWLDETLSASNYPISKPMSGRTFYQILFYYLKHPLWGLSYLWTRIRLALRGDHD